MRSFAAALIVAVCVPAFGQSLEGYGERGVEVFGQQSASQWLAEVPPDDLDKWFLSVFGSKSCGPCQKLKRALGSDPQLKSFASKVHYNYYLAEDRRQKWRFEAFKVGSVPEIIVQAPIGKYGADQNEAVVVFRQTGYSEDAGELMEKIADAIRRFLHKTPTPEPAPQPHPEPSPVPLIPPRPQPAPQPGPPQPAPQPGVIPDYAEIVLLIDPDGLLEKGKVKAGEIIAKKLNDRLGLKAKMRVVKWEDSRGLYPATRDQLPAVFYTNGGRIVGGFSVEALREVMRAGDETIVPDDPDQGTPAISDSVIYTFLAGIGIPPWLILAGLGVWAVFRRRHNQPDDDENDKDDGAFDNLLDLAKTVKNRIRAVKADADEADAELKG